MKICPACRIQNDDDAVFCTGCGNRFETGDNPVRSHVKRALTSGAFLTAVIAYTAATIFKIIAMIMNNNPGDTDYYINLLGGEGKIKEICDIIRYLDVIIIISTVLCCIGLWGIYKNISENKAGVLDKSVFLIKTGAIVEIVSNALNVVLIFIILFFVKDGMMSEVQHITLEEFSYSEEAMDVMFSGELQVFFSALFGVAAVIALFFVVFLLVYYIAGLKSLKVIREDAKEGRITGRVSTFAAVAGFILAGITLFNLFSTDIINVLKNIGDITFMIASSVALLQYKKGSNMISSCR